MLKDELPFKAITEYSSVLIPMIKAGAAFFPLVLFVTPTVLIFIGLTLTGFLNLPTRIMSVTWVDRLPVIMSVSVVIFLVPVRVVMLMVLKMVIRVVGIIKKLDFLMSVGR